MSDKQTVHEANSKSALLLQIQAAPSLGRVYDHYISMTSRTQIQESITDMLKNTRGHVFDHYTLLVSKSANLTNAVAELAETSENLNHKSAISQGDYIFTRALNWEL